MREELEELDSILRETEHLNPALYATHSDHTVEKRFKYDDPWTDDVMTTHSSGHLPAIKHFAEVEASREISKRPNVPVDGDCRRVKSNKHQKTSSFSSAPEPLPPTSEEQSCDAELCQPKKKGKKKKCQRPSKLIDQSCSRNNGTGAQVDDVEEHHQECAISSQVKVSNTIKDKDPGGVRETNRDNRRHKKEKDMNGFQTEFKISPWQIKKKRQSRQKDLDHQARNRNTGIESRAATRTLDSDSGRRSPLSDRNQSPMLFPEPEPTGNIPSQSSMRSPQYSLKDRVLNNVRNRLARFKNKVNAFCCFV